MKPVLLIAGALCIILIAGGIFLAGRSNGGARIVPLDTIYTTRVTNGYWSSGATNPKIIIEEYADFQSAGSATLMPILQQVVQQHSATLQLRFYSFPQETKHSKARLAAEVAEAAGRQGKFWPMHELLFLHLATWDTQDTTAFHDTALSYATALNLNINQFNNDLADATLDTAINAGVTHGNTVPVDTVPTLVLNGEVVKTIPTTVEGFNALIQSAKPLSNE